MPHMIGEAAWTPMSESSDAWRIPNAVRKTQTLPDHCLISYFPLFALIAALTEKVSHN